MKYSNIKYILSIVMLFFVTVSCSEDSDFEGGDNFISSFELSAGNETVKASISKESLKVKMSESFTQKDIKVNFTLSENATISPNPVTIADWTINQTFVVTAYNGATRQYTYDVEINYSVVTEGNVTLRTQAEVDAFGESKVSAIKGNLTIGEFVGDDVITSLAGLSNLKAVDYEIAINPTYTGSDLTGLENLERVGSIKIGDNESLTTINLPALKMIALDLSITNQYTEKIEMAKLQSIGNKLYFYNIVALKELSFPALEAVEGSLTLERLNNIEGNTDFPKLSTIGGQFNVQASDMVEEIILPVLKESGDMYFSGLGQLKEISFPSLESVGSFKANYNTALISVSAPLVKEVGSLNLESLYSLASADFSSLVSVEKDIYISSALLEDMSGFPSVESVGGFFLLSYMNDLTSISDMKSLKSVNNLNFSNLKKITEIDVSNAEIENINISSSGPSQGLKLKGSKQGTKKIEIYSANVLIEGFEEVDELSYSSMKFEHLEIVGLKKVNKRFVVTLQDVKESFSMPDLEEVEGSFFLNVGKIKSLSMPKLRRIGKELTFDVQSYDTFVFSLPALTAVDGDFVLQTGYSSYYGLKDFSFPKLTAIGGQLRVISIGNVTLLNQTIKNLDGFSALKTVGSVEIKSQTLLQSYEGIKNILPSLNKENWDVKFNAYNPSYDDLVAGKWAE